ncbi:MAG: hypothetical protein GX022_03320 [Clostridiaceae bacterium]|nr:hypothetical protein [Clostridiaceae bacterium]
MRNNSKYILGAILVIIGILTISGNIERLTAWLVNLTWPMMFVAIGFFFFLGYLSRRPSGAGYLVPAGIFFTLGVTFLLGEMLNSYHLVWPLFIASPAVGLLLLYLFGNRSPGLLVPIGILFTIAGTCFLSELFNLWGVLWPGFIIAPAVGLFLLYIAGNRDPGLLIPVFILTGIAVIFFSIGTMRLIGRYFKYIAGGALIIAGISTILKRPSSRRYDDQNRF